MPTATTPTFRAAVVRTPGGPDSIELVDLPVTEPGPGEVRIRVAAAAVNPVDLAVADGVFHGMGLIHQRRWTGLGWDVAGTVAAVGDGVDLAVGTRVAAIVPGFDREVGAYAEQVVTAAAHVAAVPDGLDLATASTVPLNGLAAAQITDLLGEPADGRDRLLVTGAAGEVGARVAVLAAERGWRVTGLARAEDEPFVTGLGAGFATDPGPERAWHAVVDAAFLHGDAVALVADGGTYVGVRPAAVPAAERGITVRVVETQPDAERLADLLARAAAGTLPARVHTVLPLARAGDAHRAVAKGGVRGRYVLDP